MKAELAAVRSDLDKEKDLSTKLKAQVDELKEELLTFKKRLGGTKSGKIRSANVIKPGDQCCLCAVVSQSDIYNRSFQRSLLVENIPNHLLERLFYIVLKHLCMLNFPPHSIQILK